MFAHGKKVCGSSLYELKLDQKPLCGWLFCHSEEKELPRFLTGAMGKHIFWVKQSAKRGVQTQAFEHPQSGLMGQTEGPQQSQR